MRVGERGRLGGGSGVGGECGELLKRRREQVRAVTAVRVVRAAGVWVCVGML